MRSAFLVFPGVVFEDLRLLPGADVVPIDIKLCWDDHVSSECDLRRSVSQCSVKGAADSEGAVGQNLREVWLSTRLKGHVERLCSGRVVDDSVYLFQY